jgi:hypothetical protein
MRVASQAKNAFGEDRGNLFAPLFRCHLFGVVEHGRSFRNSCPQRPSLGDRMRCLASVVMSMAGALPASNSHRPEPRLKWL